MLKAFRRGAAKKVAWVLAIMITISFVFFGIGSSLLQPDSGSYVGKIFGKKISKQDFGDAFLHVRNQAILRYGENFFKIKDFLDLESETWDRLVLLHEAKKQKIKIKNADVIKNIAELNIFKRNDKFDPSLYNQIVQYVFGCKPRDFEEGIRDSLIFKKMYEQETDPITVSDEEVLQAYKNQNEKVDISYIPFSFVSYISTTEITKEEAVSYYEEHKDDFKIPFMINVEYLALEYPEKAEDDQKSKIKDQATQLKEDLFENITISELAKKHGLTIQESGFFSSQQPNLNLGWPLELFEHALTLESNNIKGPIETSKGFYILSLKDQRESYVPSFELAKKQIESAVKRTKSKDLAKKAASESLNQIKTSFENQSNLNLDDASKNLELKIEKPAPFKRGEYLPLIGSSPEFHNAAFALTASNRLSDPVKTDNAYCILYLNAFVSINENEFEKQKEDLKQRILKDKKDNAFSNFLIRLRKEAQLEDWTTPAEQQED